MKLSPSPFRCYEIQTQISSKASRHTFLAQDVRTQERVVVKTVQFGSGSDWSDWKLFEREANILKNLDHPAIPKYRDSFEAKIDGIQNFVLVQTYIEADSLEAVVRAGRRFSEAEILEIAERLLVILSYLHEQCPTVVHRDIKPSNILIANRSGHSVGDAYLIDFGSVHTVASKESGTITIVGSYGYIPLEQFAGQAAPASDLYSLGMTLVYLMTGVHPADIPQVDGKIQLAGMSLQPKLARWLERMTHPYLDQRFDSASLALAALRAEDSRQGYFQHLKPPSTTVELYRDRTHLRIITQKQYEVVPRTGGCLFMTFFMCILLSVIPPVAHAVSMLFATLLAWTVLDFVYRLVFLNWLTPNYDVISIERDAVIQVGLRSGWLGTVHWQPRSSRFQDVDLLAYNPGYTFNHRGQTIRVLPTLSVHAGDKEYSIGCNRLSQAELWWIGQELSDFIGLEIQTIYPTPKVPLPSA